MSRKIIQVVSKLMTQHRPGFASVDNFAHEISIEPFLVFTEFNMDRQIFGPHPHAGVSVLTYMFPDSPGGFRNRDSRGDDSQILPGGAHITQAGKGIQHDETPIMENVNCHGMQIWINHSDANRWVEPKAIHAMPDEIPTVQLGDATLRVVLGEHNGTASPLQPITAVQLYHVRASPGDELTFDLPETAFIYVVHGQLDVSDKLLSTSDLAIFDPHPSQIETFATEFCQFLVAGGVPHNEPIVYGGPYVATTNEQLEETRRRFGRGEMGELLPR
ncbi:MAG: pirin family protein [Armatimonadota bacterium]